MCTSCHYSNNIPETLPKIPTLHSLEEFSSLRNAVALAAGDIDRDGSHDLLAFFSRSVTVVYSVSSPAPRVEEIRLDSTPVRRAALEDVNSDGWLDLAILSGGELALLLGSTGGFSSPQRIFISADLRSFALSDIDGDGAVDVVGADYQRSSLAILRNTGTGRRETFRRGDPNGDGVADTSDAVRILERLFLGGRPFDCPDAADANDDGQVDVSDPVRLLAYLFLGQAPLPPPGATSCGIDETPDALEACSGPCE